MALQVLAIALSEDARSAHACSVASGHGARWHHEAGLAALVEDAPDPGPEPTIERLRHIAALADSLALGTDILPIRFGSFVPDLAALERYLNHRRDFYVESLRATRGCVEFAVSMPGSSVRSQDSSPAPRSSHLDALPSPPSAEADAKRAPAPGLAYLAQRRIAQYTRDALDPFLIRELEPVASLLRPAVRRLRVDGPSGVRPFPCMRCEVERVALSHFKAAFVAARQRTPHRLVLSGPTPPSGVIATDETD